MIGQIYDMDELSSQLTQTLLVFRLEGQSYALAIENVVQIIPMLRLTPVPQIEHAIEGVANIHGTVVPVIAARQHLGLPMVTPGLYTPIVLSRVGERTVGLIVDEVTDVINVPADQLISPDDMLPDGLSNSPVMQSVVYLEDRSILVLDPRNLLRPAQIRALNRAIQTSGAAAMPATRYPPAAPLRDLEPEPCDDEPQMQSYQPVVRGNGGGGLSKQQMPAAPEEIQPADQTPPQPTADIPAAELPAAELPAVELPAVSDAPSASDASAAIAPAPTEQPEASPANKARSSSKKKGSRK